MLKYFNHSCYTSLKHLKHSYYPNFLWPSSLIDVGTFLQRVLTWCLTYPNLFGTKRLSCCCCCLNTILFSIIQRSKAKSSTYHGGEPPCRLIQHHRLRLASIIIHCSTWKANPRPIHHADIAPSSRARVPPPSHAQIVLRPPAEIARWII
jgi:hypothetical protein